MQRTPSRWFYFLTPLIWISAPAFSEAKQATDQAAATLYKEECSSCHMAYPANLLPSRSWDKILNQLGQHFGEDASLDAATLRQLRRYLQDNSADAVNSHRSRRLLRSLPANRTPLRISELPYIRHKHDEIPARYISGNPQVKHLSNCNACHQGAGQGIFNEHQVRIPGYGQWDD